MKTAMQIAIENIDQCLNSEDVKAMLGELLELEKQQIIEAYHEGKRNYGVHSVNESERYYNETFKPE